MRTTQVRRLWDKPRLLTDEEQEKVSKDIWLELFFDLIFVIAIAQVSHIMIHDLSWEGAGKFILVIVPIFWCWIGSTSYDVLMSRTDVSHRFTTLALMVPVLGLALTANHAFEEGAAGFAISYATFRAILILMWWRVGRHNPDFRPISDVYVLGFSISAILWGTSAFVEAPVNYVMWIIGLAIDFVTPFVTFKTQERLPKYISPRLPDRYGFFIIIVLGESVFALIIGASALEVIDLPVMITCTLGLVLAFGLWWLYFGHVTNTREDQSIYWTTLAIWMHFPLVIGLVALGAAITNVLTHGYHDVDDGTLWLACGALATALFSLGVIRLAVEGMDQRDPIAALFIGSGVALLIAALIGRVDQLMLLGLLATLVWLLVIYRMHTDARTMGGEYVG
jgi:low temperature requirement protein LtrA